MYFNSKGKIDNIYDVIVVGLGISGGWAVKEFCEKGLKIIVLECGCMVCYGDYFIVMKEIWELFNCNKFIQEEFKDYFKQQCMGYIMVFFIKYWWVKDMEYFYIEEKCFDWIWGYYVGGCFIMWGWYFYWLSDLDFEVNVKDGYGVDWLICYKDLVFWYDYVECFVGIQGIVEGLFYLLDG